MSAKVAGLHRFYHFPAYKVTYFSADKRTTHEVCNKKAIVYAIKVQLPWQYPLGDTVQKQLCSRFSNISTSNIRQVKIYSLQDYKNVGHSVYSGSPFRSITREIYYD